MTKMTLIHPPAIEAVQDLINVQNTKWSIIDTINVWGLIYKAVKHGHSKEILNLVTIATEQVRKDQNKEA
jgi:hypothetical protein